MRQKSDHLKFDTFESIHLEVTCNSKSARVMNVYRSGRDKHGNIVAFDQFLKEFENMIEDYLFHPSDILICGDFNIHVDNPADCNANRFKSLLQSHSLVQYVNGPTHIRGHCLDLLLTRSSSDLISEVHFHPGLSDHYGIMATINLTKIPLLSTTLKTRNLKQVDINQFSDDVCMSLSGINIELNSVDCAVRYYEEQLTGVLDRHAPISTRTVRSRPSSPWFTEDIRLARQACRRCERHWRKAKTTSNRDSFNLQKDTVHKLINHAITEHYSTKIDESHGDQKKLFSIVKGLLNTTSKRVMPTAESDEALVNTFSEYFSNKIAEIRSMFTLHNAESKIEDIQLSSTAATKIPTLDTFCPVTKKEIEAVIMKAPSKSCELDPVPMSLIKRCVNVFSPFITSLVNKSFAEAIFPDSLKIAYIRPLLKKAGLDEEVLRNYRPISNLKFLGKTLERVVCARIHKHASEHDLSDAFQSAYKPNHGVETALLRVHNDIMCAFDNGEVSALVLLDLSAAFDTVDHKLLLSRLKSHLGIDGQALKWFKSYLLYRPQYVRIGSSISNPVYQDYSVPQGSVLGPVLFTVYTSPLRNVIMEHNVQYHFYADDTQLYLRLKPSQCNVDIGIKTLESCLRSVSQWMNDNFLKLNEDKTEYMLIGSARQLSTFSAQKIMIGNSEIKCVNQVRNLGVLFDAGMTMKSQISNVVSSASFHIHNIWRIRKYLNQKATEQIVHSFITCRLDMCNSLYTGLPQNQISRLQRVQNMAARLVTLRSRSDSISDILKSLHWLSVSKRIMYKLLLITYKTLLHSSPHYLYQILKPYIPQRNLRSGSQLQLCTPKTNNKWGDRTFANVAPKLWNTLPLEIRQSSSVEIFKKKLKHHLFMS